MQQECIPVGCVPPAHWPYCLVCFLRGWPGLGGGGQVTRSDQGGGGHPQPHLGHHPHPTSPPPHLGHHPHLRHPHQTMSPIPWCISCHPPQNWTDRCLWKHNLRSLRYAGGKNVVYVERKGTGTSVSQFANIAWVWMLTKGGEHYILCFTFAFTKENAFYLSEVAWEQSLTESIIKLALQDELM